QVDRQRDDVQVTAADLLTVPQGKITEQGVRWNIKVGIQYLEAWLGGNGCVPLYYLMEDAATAEISRTQIWQWLHHQVQLEDGRRFTGELYDQFVQEELQAIEQEIGIERYKNGHFPLATQIFTDMSRNSPLVDFLTLPAYEYL
ncbi:MAG: malate synthase A, partial [Anaerolineae bacterium]|nr:malate synthase A [Anaerolineae bacterium]